MNIIPVRAVRSRAVYSYEIVQTICERVLFHCGVHVLSHSENKRVHNSSKERVHNSQRRSEGGSWEAHDTPLVDFFFLNWTTYII